MANNWGIPIEVEVAVRLRDQACVYCGINFAINHISRKTMPTWEHIVNDIRLNGIDNIAICCTSCNASKGAKPIEDWLKSDYCKTKHISFDSVAKVIKEAILNPPVLKT